MGGPCAVNVLQICMLDHAPKIRKEKGVKLDQTVHVITARDIFFNMVQLGRPIGFSTFISCLYYHATFIEKMSNLL